MKSDIKPVDFNLLARTIMFTAVTEQELLKNFKLEYRKNKTVTDIKKALQLSAKNGQCKTELELDLFELHLEKIFKKNQICKKQNRQD